MGPDTGRHGTDENASDRARIAYLTGDGDVGPEPVELTGSDRAELDDLRALLADPTLWAEPPAELENSVVAAITAEAGRGTDAGAAGPDAAQPFPFTAEQPARVEPTSPTAPGEQPPIDLGAARQARRGRGGGRRFTRPVFLVAAAAAVVAVALSAVLLLRDNSTQRRFDVALSATDLAPGATGSATMLKTDSGWQIKLEATGLPRLDGGTFYQAWLRNADGVLVPIGTFNEGTDVTLWSGVSPDTFSTMTITRESADGVQDSSGQRVLVGSAVED